MSHTWQLKPQPPAEAVQRLQQDLGVSLPLATLLAQRGLDGLEDSKFFFRPQLDQLHDPFLMQDMDKAVARLDQALQTGEKILVYGDYDVDGTTAVSLFYGFLKDWGYTQLDFYIPDRYKEGYGLQVPGLEFARDNGFGLIISLDCGIKSVEWVQLAQSWGIDTIICDHHLPGPTLPPAVAVLDPKRNDCAYPFKELTGCGVGFKLLQAWCQAQGRSGEELFPYLDLVVTSIACDIVPMVGENRILAYFGLQQLNQQPRTGLKALQEVAGLTNSMDISNVVFGLGPRINAAGRINHAYDAVYLLLCDDMEQARALAELIQEHNQGRKQLDSNITEEAIGLIENNHLMREAHSTVLFKPDWHKGVIGIVASRCIEKYHRPTVILTESNGKAAGSARSVAGFDLYEALDACSQHLIQFGGHSFAAGMSLEISKVEDFRQAFEDYVSAHIQPAQLIPTIEVDLSLPFSEINDKFYRILQKMSPFGPHNMTPTFVTEEVWLHERPFKMKEKHLKLQVYQAGTPVFTAIGFGMAEAFFEKLPMDRPFKICYQISQNEWQGRRSLQLMLRDIQV
jgi:single-stranded-DNA-specific exonuclease